MYKNSLLILFAFLFTSCISNKDIDIFSSKKPVVFQTAEYSKKLKAVLDKLNNKDFIHKAPNNVIENFKIQEKEINSSIEKIDEIINTIN